jgi:hypothetical protein
MKKTHQNDLVTVRTWLLGGKYIADYGRAKGMIGY